MDVLIRPAHERCDFDACVALQREVWGLTDLEVTSAIQLVATVHAGGLLLVAESAGDGVVGFCYAFAALRGGDAHLHTDMLAVRDSLRGHGIGARLKWAQREEALHRGLRLVTWTFDPMRCRCPTARGTWGSSSPGQTRRPRRRRRCARPIAGCASSSHPLADRDGSGFLAG